MKQHKHIHITGHVQGVSFRASAAIIAQQLAINGFIRNEDDGSVYVEVEGESKNLEKFISWCHTGPRLAKVENVEVTDGPLVSFSSFSTE